MLEYGGQIVRVYQHLTRIVLTLLVIEKLDIKRRLGLDYQTVIKKVKLESRPLLFEK